MQNSSISTTSVISTILRQHNLRDLGHPSSEDCQIRGPLNAKPEHDKEHLGGVKFYLFLREAEHTRGARSCVTQVSTLKKLVCATARTPPQHEILPIFCVKDRTHLMRGIVCNSYPFTGHPTAEYTGVV